MRILCGTFVSTLLFGTSVTGCQPASNPEDRSPEKYVNDRLNSSDQAQAPIAIKPAESEFKLDCQKQSFMIVNGAWVGVQHSLTESLVKIYGANATCTGTVIGARHILTAAHCLRNMTDPQSIRIGVGVSGEWDSRIKIQAYRIHPNYSGLENLETNNLLPVGLYDVALLMSEENLPSSLRAVGIAKSSDLVAGNEAYVAGFGAYGEGDYLPRPLTAAWIRLSEVVPERSEIQIESSNFSGPCYGDSGGPLLIMNAAQSQSCFLLAGSITGRGRGDLKGCDSGRATVMDLSRFQDWVQCSLNEWNTQSNALLQPPFTTDCR